MIAVVAHDLITLTIVTDHDKTGDIFVADATSRRISKLHPAPEKTENLKIDPIFIFIFNFLFLAPERLALISHPALYKCRIFYHMK